MIANQMNAAPLNIHTSRPPYFTCMTNKTTSVALIEAMIIATRMFAPPRSMREAMIVRIMKSISHT